ncbi:hypothetical protein CRM22_010508 [Opisthorchis felineus]|uniref:CSN8/PSMD8/EIF3K domain-containing protein n=1 Tax=Opisthorchis felineus TaxID=147828 RepID=A0A4S2L3E9_OPIFE|nr:hypothetical protein CRM22_010508 [Opisthorchis felineus]
MSIDTTAINQQLVELELCELSRGPQIQGEKLQFSNASLSTPEEYYIQFLSLYTLKGDFLNAKLLWQRIPLDVKESSDILSTLWNLIRFLIKRDLSAFFHFAGGVLNDQNYPGSFRYLLRQICDNQKLHAINLLGDAYSCVTISFVCDLLNVPESEATSLMFARGWKSCPEGKFLLHSVEPLQKVCVDESQQTNNDDIMSKLADFMCFIENH